MKRKALLVIFGLILLFSCFSAMSAAGSGKTQNYIQLQQRVYLPQAKTPAPLVVLVHNGGSNQEAWTDFPRELAAQGWVVLTMDWEEFKTTYDIEKSVGLTLKQYADRIDATKTAFVSGCHGGSKTLLLFGKLKKLSYKIQTVVALGISEPAYADMVQALKNEHPPVLAFYSLKDNLGEKYQVNSKKFAEEVLTQPKQVVSIDAAPHGDELTADEGTKGEVRKQIVVWLKDYLK